MAAPFKPDGCFYMDDEGAVFSISAFISLNGLPDDPRRIGPTIQQNIKSAAKGAFMVSRVP
jgi:hypothetical protein